MNSRDHRKSAVLFAALLALSMPLAAGAANSVLSGTFDGSEPAIDPLPGTCNGAGMLRYQAVSPVRVSADGEYTITDANNFNRGDISAQIYQDSFNPDSPQANLLTPGGIDVSGQINLAAGVDYVLVVQNWCENLEGVWTVTFSGPGDTSSDRVVTPPAMTEGFFAGSDPTSDSECGNSQYQQTGPVRVSRDGMYYYWDASIRFDVDMCLQVYTAPFDANNPNANRVGNAMDDFAILELEAGRDYWFVAQPLNEATEGEFFYVFAPPAPFRINYAMSGSWFNPATDGQGFFMDVFEDLNQLFLAWFTFDLERPDGGTAMIGESEHRWMTAFGPFSGNTAETPIYWTSGMVFDSPTPPKNDNVQDGNMTIEFFDCYKGQVTYDLGSAGVQGVVPIQRLSNDAVPLCQSLFEGPGQPGPL